MQQWSPERPPIVPQCTTQPHNKESPDPTCTPSCIWRSYGFLIELCQHGKHGHSHTRLLGRSFQENWEQGWVRGVNGGDFDKPSIMILPIFLCLYQKRESATFKLHPVYSLSLDSASESLTLQLTETILFTDERKKYTQLRRKTQLKGHCD